MSGDSKFFIGVAAVAVAVIALIIVFSSGDTGGSAEIDTTVGHKVGSDDAPVKIVEFGDFQCPACKAAEPELKTALERNSDKVQFIYRHFPLPGHPNAEEAALASEAAANQGKFWEMHDMLFDTQSEWENVSNPDSIFESYASALSLDMERFRSDYKASATINKVKADQEAANDAQVNQTPTFFVNGERVVGGQSADEWQQIIDEVAGS
jgi:protein-disulfide isomerase